MGQETFVKLIVTLWSIRWVRRKAVHEEQFQSPLTTFSFNQRYLLDLQILQAGPPIQRSLATVQNPRWIASPESEVAR